MLVKIEDGIGIYGIYLGYNTLASYGAAGTSYRRLSATTRIMTFMHYSWPALRLVYPLLVFMTVLDLPSPNALADIRYSLPRGY